MLQTSQKEMDVSLHFTEQGSGKPIILLHGNGESGEYFVHQINYFSKKYRVIAIDTRGHGLSPRGVSPFTIRQFADDLLNFMEEHKIDKADILGFSDGANIAMIFALNYQERINRLILNGGNLNAKGVKPSVQIPIELGYKIASLFAKRSENARKKAEMLGLMVNDPNINPNELKQLKVPVLVIAGTKDMIKDKHTRLIRESISGAGIKIIPGNHFIANKNFKQFNEAVEEFLNQGKQNLNDSADI